MLAPDSELRKDSQLNAMILVSELERAQLAELIHDDVLQILGAGLLAAETCEQAWRLDRKNLLPEQLANLRRVLEQGVGRLRHLMADLRPYRPELGGLDGSLQGVFRAYVERNRGTITLEQDIRAKLNNTAELIAYRLIVEALWSVRNIDEPMQVQIELRANDGSIELLLVFRTVQESEEQRDAPEVQTGIHSLLSPKRIALLRWRAQALDGSLVEEPLEPSLTQVRIQLPMPA